MQKSRLGINLGIVGAFMFISALSGSYLLTAIIAGYILLCEKSTTLRSLAIFDIILVMGFTVVYAFLPKYDLYSSLSYYSGFDVFIRVFSRTVQVLEKVIFLGLGIFAYVGQYITLPERKPKTVAAQPEAEEKPVCDGEEDADAVEITVDASAAAVCGACGSELAENAAFCTECGAPVAK